MLRFVSTPHGEVAESTVNPGEGFILVVEGQPDTPYLKLNTQDVVGTNNVLNYVTGQAETMDESTLVRVADFLLTVDPAPAS